MQIAVLAIVEMSVCPYVAYASSLLLQTKWPKLESQSLF